MATSFKQLIEKVGQAENALEAKERQVAADWRQLKASWKTGWTPGRIVIAGLVSGFVVGRIEPARGVAKGNSIMQMITALSGLFASATAQHAASHVETVADDVGDVADTVQSAVPDHAPVDA
ncbi:hypothetical protein DWG18_11685 [Lysobacter sp. TY2-98]|uniref:hypothetical protein n=1 Tax=Lysobacter sp. TY2-98 TaxID=2290922 RepID=UPI000E2053CD|nr:hypothetical protein [Lysobacter sp. TY2-98]AXK72875.1 hypothetical protein DWG18_11685 [Lysobacter sp. TY2-98]